MRSIKLGDTEYALRVDLNVAEYVYKHFGGFDNILISMSIGEFKEILALMINEHLKFINSSVIVTPDYVGSRLELSDYKKCIEIMCCAIAESLELKKN